MPIEKIINHLTSAGFEAYFVGGCVRDLLMGKTPKDIDITTNATPPEIEEVFKCCRVIETGLKHGTLTVMIGETPVEITTYRTDGDYSDHRHPDRVCFTTNLKEDLARRDFTINAMAWCPKKTPKDPLGGSIHELSEGLVDIFGGQKDLKNRLIRCVGNPETRFEEDGLRILRALRFASVLNFQIEQKTSEAIFIKKELLKVISTERIWEEIKKLLTGSGAGSILLQYIDVLGVVIPELLPMKHFQQNNQYHSYDLPEHTAKAIEHISKAETASPSEHLKIAALFHDIGKPHTYTKDEQGQGHFYGHATKSAQLAESILLRMKADNLTRERVGLLIKYHDADLLPEKKNIKKWLGKLSPQVLEELVDLKEADILAQNPDKKNRQEHLNNIRNLIKEILTKEECFSLKQLAVSGEDLLTLGIKEGPEVGVWLDKLLKAVLVGELENRKETLLHAVKKGADLAPGD